jgi:hypothetical protein
MFVASKRPPVRTRAFQAWKATVSEVAGERLIVAALVFSWSSDRDDRLEQIGK